MSELRVVDRTCSAAGCTQPVKARGLCSSHYDRFRRRGVFVTHSVRGKTVEEKLLLNHAVDAESGCWRWQAGHGKDGYGQLNHQRAHRLAYELWVGPIPPGLHLDHVAARGCKYRDCINPAHLQPVTIAENNRRRDLMRYGVEKAQPSLRAECGTVKGRRLHQSEGERTCNSCAAAWAEYQRTLRRRRAS